MANIKLPVPFDGRGQLFYSELDSSGEPAGNLKKIGQTQGFVLNPVTTSWSIQNLEDTSGGNWAQGSDLDSLDGTITLASMDDDAWSLLLLGESKAITADATEKVVSLDYIGGITAGSTFSTPDVIDTTKPVIVGTYTGDTPTKATTSAITNATNYTVLNTSIEFTQDQTVTQDAKYSIAYTALGTTEIPLFQVNDRSVRLVLEGYNKRLSSGGALRLTIPKATITTPSSFAFKEEGAAGYQSYDIPFSAVKTGNRAVATFIKVTGS